MSTPVQGPDTRRPGRTAGLHRLCTEYDVAQTGGGPAHLGSSPGERDLGAGESPQGSVRDREDGRGTRDGCQPRSHPLRTPTVPGPSEPRPGRRGVREDPAPSAPAPHVVTLTLEGTHTPSRAPGGLGVVSLTGVCLVWTESRSVSLDSRGPRVKGLVYDSPQTPGLPRGFLCRRVRSAHTSRRPHTVRAVGTGATGGVTFDPTPLAEPPRRTPRIHWRGGSRPRPVLRSGSLRGTGDGPGQERTSSAKGRRVVLLGVRAGRALVRVPLLYPTSHPRPLLSPVRRHGGGDTGEGATRSARYWRRQRETRHEER